VKAIMLFRNMSSLTESKRFSNLTGSDLNFICRDLHSMFPWTHNSMGVFFSVFWSSISWSGSFESSSCLWL
jgi:hypothetical protein